jgi:hypothetical protein
VPATGRGPGQGAVVPPPPDSPYGPQTGAIYIAPGGEESPESHLESYGVYGTAIGPDTGSVTIYPPDTGSIPVVDLPPETGGDPGTGTGWPAVTGETGEPGAAADAAEPRAQERESE